MNLGSTPSSLDLATKVKVLVEELEQISQKDLASQLKGMSVFDINKVTTCITLLATEVAPPAEEGASFKFNKRIGSSSFDPSLKRKPQSRRSFEAKGAPGSAPAQAETNAETKAETNAETNAVQPEDDEVQQQSWI